jgi:hypothetical protein
MPAKKTQIMRPTILHCSVAGLGEGPRTHDDALTSSIYIPPVLSIKPVATPGEGGEAWRSAFAHE